MSKVRFIRCYDVTTSRMVNVWTRVPDDEPHVQAVELCCEAPTFEQVMTELETLPWLEDELADIRAAYHEIKDAKPAFYGMLDELRPH